MSILLTNHPLPQLITVCRPILQAIHSLVHLSDRLSIQRSIHPSIHPTILSSPPIIHFGLYVDGAIWVSSAGTRHTCPQGPQEVRGKCEGRRELQWPGPLRVKESKTGCSRSKSPGRSVCRPSFQVLFTSDLVGGHGKISLGVTATLSVYPLC